MKQILDIEDKRIWVQGLLIECPMGVALDKCPARSLREIPLKQRLRVAAGMDEAQLDEIIGYHRACLAERER